MFGKRGGSEMTPKQQAEAKGIADRLNAMSTPLPAAPEFGPITQRLIDKQKLMLGVVDEMNREISQLDSEIAWWKRNQLAEQYFPKVAAILDSLRPKEDDKPEVPNPAIRPSGQ